MNSKSSHIPNLNRAIIEEARYFLLPCLQVAAEERHYQEEVHRLLQELSIKETENAIKEEEINKLQSQNEIMMKGTAELLEEKGELKNLRHFAIRSNYHTKVMRKNAPLNLIPRNAYFINSIEKIDLVG